MNDLVFLLSFLCLINLVTDVNFSICMFLLSFSLDICVVFLRLFTGFYILLIDVLKTFLEAWRL